MTNLPASLLVLPTRTGGAAENMALDFLLLNRASAPATPRFRHYEWRAAAFTFGFSQKIAWVRDNLPPRETFDLCRRPTGGGIVDHRNDWTYSLVIPRGHAWYDTRASDSYRIVHECLAAALVELGQPAELAGAEVCRGVKPLPQSAAEDPVVGGNSRPGANEEPETGPATCGLPGICFQKAERFDVVNSRTGAKIAGAAQKRSKHGMLFQGSIEKGAIGVIDWDDFQDDFTAALARAMGLVATGAPWPELAEHEVEGLIEQYSSPEWLDYR